MKKLFALIILSMSTAVSASESYTVDARHTFPSFSISHLGFSTQRGRFNQTSGKISLSPEKQTGYVEISIKTDSIDTGLVELEQHLKTADFLDAARYPTITFVSTKLKFEKEVLTEIDGTLTLHGKTQPVHLKVNHFHCGINPIALKNECGANAVTSFKRSDFGIDKYVPMISDDVNVEIQIEAIKD
jgi:polyisoprenoid-binding protein YceI